MAESANTCNDCSLHQETLVLYCVQCQDTICLQCLTENHQGHSVQKIEVTRTDLCAQIQEVISRLENYNKQLILGRTRACKIYQENIQKVEVARIKIKADIDKELDKLTNECVHRKEKDVEKIDRARSTVCAIVKKKMVMMANVEEGQLRSFADYKKQVEAALQDRREMASCCVQCKSTLYEPPSPSQDCSALVGSLSDTLQPELQLVYSQVTVDQDEDETKEGTTRQPRVEPSKTSNRPVITEVNSQSDLLKNEDAEMKNVAGTVPHSFSSKESKITKDADEGCQHVNVQEAEPGNTLVTAVSSVSNDFTTIRVDTDTGLPVVKRHLKSAACHLTTGQTVMVEVKEMISPSLWWVWLTENPEVDKLVELRREMTKYYGQKKETNSYSPTQKSLVAAKFEVDRQWYRGEVINFNTHSVRVRFIDFGNESIVPLSWVHSLESRHLSMPAQAVCVSLAGVDATESGWSESTSNCVSRFVAETELKSVVTKCDKFSAQLRVFTKDNRDLSRILVDNGFAKSVRSEDVINSASSRSPREGDCESNTNEDRLVFICNLHYKIEESKLVHDLQNAGKLSRIQLIYGDKGRFNGTAIIWCDKPTAEEIRCTFNEKDYYGRSMFVQRESTGNIGQRLVLSNVPEETTVADIQDRLLELDPPVVVRIHKDMEGNRSGTADVYLQSNKDAKRVKQLLADMSVHTLETVKSRTSTKRETRKTATIFDKVLS